MVRTPIKKSRYIFALILTILIFLLGVLIGNTLTNLRAQFIEKLSEQQRLEFDSLQLQYLYMDEFLQENNCPAALKTLDQNLNNLEITREKLERYLEKDDQELLKNIKRDYTLSQIRYWLLYKKVKQICNEQDFLAILYFYSVDSCKDCEPQGAILTSLRQDFKDRLLIFSIDASFTEEPMISILKQFFNFESTPAMVINDKIIREFTKKEELKQIICQEFKRPPEECNGKT